MSAQALSSGVVLDEALRSGSFYVNQRWLGGILTNYRVQKRIKRLLKLKKWKLPARSMFIRKLLDRKAVVWKTVGGIKEMKKLPDAIFVVDLKKNTCGCRSEEAEHSGLRWLTPAIRKVDFDSSTMTRFVQ
ncbi:MAG: 30S ribosomal protein S2 [Merdibacter sp.]